LLLSWTLSVTAHDFPVCGKTFTIRYTPARNSALAHATSMTLVYVFDYWSARMVAEPSAAFLFGNVTNPDPARVHRSAMVSDGGMWKAQIEIPTDVSLVSWYFTDGENTDYNQNNTYVSYVYTEQHKPVFNARYRNVHFLLMAQKSSREQLNEIAAELKDYPANYVAYIPFWTLRFDTAEGDARLRSLFKEMKLDFNRLQHILGPSDSLINIKAGVLFRYAMRLRREGTGQEESAVLEFKQIVDSIPPSKRFRTIQSIYRSWFGGN
jgi:hypothetical protein